MFNLNEWQLKQSNTFWGLKIWRCNSFAKRASSLAAAIAFDLARTSFMFTSPSTSSCSISSSGKLVSKMTFKRKRKSAFSSIRDFKARRLNLCCFFINWKWSWTFCRLASASFNNSDNFVLEAFNCSVKDKFWMSVLFWLPFGSQFSCNTKHQRLKNPQRDAKLINFYSEWIIDAMRLTVHSIQLHPHTKTCGSQRRHCVEGFLPHQKFVQRSCGTTGSWQFDNSCLEPKSVGKSNKRLRLITGCYLIGFWTHLDAL